MKEDIKSEGKCPYCEKAFAQTGMARHLATHLKQMEKESGQEPATAFHLQVKAGKYFLHLLVKSTITFGEVDSFLRAIWLECCGHMSMFYIDPRDEFDMEDKLKSVLKPGMVFFHDYDFGSTTTLELKCQDLYHIKLKENILLLSRNEPLKILCDECGERPAVAICLEHMYSGDDCFFCKKCIPIHKKECDSFEEMQLPVVNSPRMGVCGYTGGRIDTKRDGVYKVK